MTDSEIIKAFEELRKEQEDGYVTALEHGGKRDEAYEGFLDLLGATIDLINRLQAANEALIAGQETLQKYVATQQAEIDRLQNESTGNCELAMSMRSDHSIDGDCNYCVEQAKAEAVKEFVERLEDVSYSYPAKFVFFKDINLVYKEVTTIATRRKEDEGK